MGKCIDTPSRELGVDWDVQPQPSAARCRRQPQRIAAQLQGRLQRGVVACDCAAPVCRFPLRKCRAQAPRPRDGMLCRRWTRFGVNRHMRIGADCGLVGAYLQNACTTLYYSVPESGVVHA